MQHIRVLSRHAKHKIVYLFDGDEAGQRAADRAARFIDESMLPEAGRKQVDLCAVTLPDNLDPADFVVQRGGEAIQELIDNAVPLLRYAIDRKLRGRNLVDFGEKGRALTEVLELLAPIKHSVLAQEYAGYIADCLQLDVNAVVEKLASTRETRQFEPSQASAGAAAPGASHAQSRIASAREGTPAHRTRFPVVVRKRALDRFGVCGRVGANGVASRHSQSDRYATARRAC